MSNETARIYHADYNQIAVSLLAKETAINTEQTLSHTILPAETDILGFVPRREDNVDEATGMEEADIVYNLGNLTEGTLNFEKAKTQDFLLAYGYGLGSPSVAAWGTGYEHTIVPLESRTMPGFTAAQRYGKTIAKRRFASLYVDQVTGSFAKDSWAKCVASLKGTGKFTVTLQKETVTAAYNATSLTLAANPVHGSTAADRVNSVHQIRVIVPSTTEYVEVAFSAVSAATPAVITITAPGGVATSTSYEILYSTTEPAWASFPARVDETALRVTDLIMKIGGKWNGTTFLGGRTLDSEIESIEHNLTNDMKIEYRVGGTGTYANFAMRGGRAQTLKLNREAREYILQQKIVENEYFGVYMKATGPEFESGKNYYVEMIFPRCAILSAPWSVNDRKIAEAGDIKVLQDSTYGSTIVKIGNKIATVAA
jgi:hypothetical protein